MSKVTDILKTLVITYAITGIMLLVLAFLLMKLNMSEWQITAGIVVVYGVSSFVGGYILAKKEKIRRLLWGLIIGFLYFVVLFVTSIIIGKGISSDAVSIIRALIVSMITGAAGAFATPPEK